MRKLIFFFLLFPCAIFCQNNYKNGYIVGISGDTSYGSIRQDPEAYLIKSIQFKTRDDKPQKLTIKDISAFGFDEGSQFRVVSYVDPLDSLARKTHFAKLLLEGNHDLYSFLRKNNEDFRYFVVSSKDTSYLLHDDVRSPEGFIKDSENYHDLLYSISHECPATGASTIYIHYGEKDLMTFFASLDKCEGNAQGTKSFYSKPKSEAHFFVMAAGFVLGNETEMTAQALAEFVSPTLSAKSSLMTGFVYLHYSNKFSRTVTSTFDTTTTNYHEITDIYEIPLILRFKFLDKAIQPYVYAGTGLAIKKEQGYLIENPEQLQQQNFGITLILGAGIDARITKNLFIKAEWRYDLLAHLPYIGIVYRI